MSGWRWRAVALFGIILLVGGGLARPATAEDESLELSALEPVTALGAPLAVRLEVDSIAPARPQHQKPHLDLYRFRLVADPEAAGTPLDASTKVAVRFFIDGRLDHVAKDVTLPFERSYDLSGLLAGTHEILVEVRRGTEQIMTLEPAVLTTQGLR